jgi:hypothetical protein
MANFFPRHNFFENETFRLFIILSQAIFTIFKSLCFYFKV